MTQFTDLGLSRPLVAALEAKNYTQPTPIQAQAIPVVLEGSDLIGIAQTGTGKTAAFMLPSLDRLVAARTSNNGGRPMPGRARMLVLAPTRELAAQIAQSARTYAKGQHLSVGVIFGGIPVPRSIREVSRGLDVLVATPGRLLDLVDQRALDLSALEILVLDEADQMLDLGFIHALKRIASIIPAKRQTLFFSATMPKAIRQLANAYCRNPVEVAVTPVASTAERIGQTVSHVNQAEKQALLTRVLGDRPAGRTLVFSRTKHGADKIVRLLEAAGIGAGAIHGNKSQPQRERALAAFRQGSMPVLVATDIAARGIDIPGVELVVNFDLPDVPEQYVHRIGRTARAGAEGQAIAFCSPDERHNLRDIEKLVRTKLPEAPLPDDFRATVEAVKALRPARTPIAEQTARRGGGGGMKADRRADGRRRDHRNERSAKPQYQPKRADGSVPGEARGPVRNPVKTGQRAAEGQRHSHRADGHPGHRPAAKEGHRPSGGQGKRPFRGRGRPGGGQRASA